MNKEKQIEEMATIMCGNDCEECARESAEFYKQTIEEARNNICLIKNCAKDLYNAGYRKINMDKWKRILDRNRKELQRLRDNEENLSKFGQHDLGYFKGRVSVLEDLFDELDMEVDDND